MFAAVAKRRALPPRTRRIRRPAARKPATDRWLLLLGIAAAVVLTVGLLGPRLPDHKVARPQTMAEARASNTAVPTERSQRGIAAAYHFSGGPASRAQAVDCLATAALYEAGDDPRGRAAVIQVVLNRVQAPGFPKTVCGVVYQDHARPTGCQFSFACDGSVARRTEHLGWAKARQQARRALVGYVFAEVGAATYYHANWAVPYWRGSLVKVAQVGTHLFYVRPLRTPDRDR